MDKIMYNSDKIAWVSYLSMIEFNKGQKDQEQWWFIDSSNTKLSWESPCSKTIKMGF